MHIVLYSLRDWPVADEVFDPANNRLTRLTGGLAEMIDSLAPRHPDIVFLSGFEHGDGLLVEIEAVCALLPNTIFVAHGSPARPDYLLGLMRAGVREVLTDDTPQAIRDVIERVRIRRAATTAAKARRIAFISAKGGDGGSFVAASFAWALAQESDSRVLLIDLALPFGDVEMFLTNQPAPSDLADVSNEIERLDRALLDSMVQHLGRNLRFIPSPSSFDKIVKIDAEKVARLVDVAARYYDYVIFDLGPSIDPISLPVLEKLDQLHIIASTIVPSIRRTSQLLRLWESLGYSSSMVSVVVNRFDSDTPISTNEMERVIGKPISRTLPNEFGGVQESLLKGRSILEILPKSRFSLAILEWAGELTGKPPPQGKGLWQRLKTR